tara:strand:- start:1894 stop:2307 length:414 start_codon:yes stop_codon:yes gene_type:complete
MNKEQIPIYVVTEGIYSDYKIVAICEDKSDAELIVKAIDGEYRSPRIENWILNPGIDQLRKGLVPWCVRMESDGDILECFRGDGSYDLSGALEDNPNRDVNNNIFMMVFARDEAHAVKVAGERRIRFLREEELNRGC